MARNFSPIWSMFFYVFFCYIIKVKKIYVILSHCCNYFFLLHSSLLVPLAYACFKSIDCILLSSLELKSILLIYSVKIFCVSLLNLCCVFNISSLFLMNSSELSTSVLFLSKYFILFSISAASKQFL